MTVTVRGRWFGMAAALSCILVIWAGWHYLGQRTPRNGQRTLRNVVLIVIDTLRPDHLGAYGYQRNTSPFLNQIAKQGVLFDDVVSSASSTFPSVNSLLTSQPSISFPVAQSDGLGISHRFVTLAEAFRRDGFRTAAVSASPVVRGTPSRYSMGGTFSEGFERFDEQCGTAKDVLAHTAPCVTSHALSMLSSFSDERFFLYVHYLDPHDPYQPPASANRFVQPYEGAPFVAAGITWPVTHWLYEGGPDPLFDDRDLQHLRDLYDGEIRSVDDNLRKLFEELPSSSRREETLFVIVADHGESFMEHRQMQHGRSAYQSELRVPLLFHWPSKWGRGERRSEPVCSIDVMPTILALAGLPIPKEAHGTPLLSSMTRREHPCFSVGAMDWVTLRPMLVALRTRSRKLIYDRKRDAYELYELRDDPGEGRNLDGQLDSQTTEQLAVMKQALQAWAHRWEPGGSGGQVELDEKTTDALRALGYIE